MPSLHFAVAPEEDVFRDAGVDLFARDRVASWVIFSPRLATFNKRLRFAAAVIGIVDVVFFCPSVSGFVAATVNRAAVAVKVSSVRVLSVGIVFA